MKKILLISLFLYLFPACVYAQSPKKSSSHFLVFGSYMYHINRPDVETTGTKKFMTANNTDGYQVGIGYEYSTKYNVNFSIQSAYGVQEQHIEWDFSFEDFDPNVNFGDFRLAYQYKKKAPYFNTTVFVGYDYKPAAKSPFIIQAKAGIGAIHYLTWNIENRYQILYYSKGTTPDTVFAKHFATTDPESGSTNWRTRNFIYSFYLGITHVGKGFIAREYRLGIAYTSFVYGGYKTARGFYYNSKGERIGFEAYSDQFRTISLVASIGL
jgi:hypothetical protein